VGLLGTDEAGSERRDAHRIKFEGEYDATGKIRTAKNTKAKLTVEPAGNLLSGSCGATTTDGVGLSAATHCCGHRGSRCGFVVYQVQSDGSLDWDLGGGGSDKTETEKATKQ